ncbi:hypothetical protein MYX84_15965 [Acidobacteria bacterium AH-259-O06]|nr:hypothetical protein [Acidobacteria bacterium AH-259-O06]
MERLTKLSMLGLLFGLVTALAVGTVVTIAGKANAGGPGNIGFGTLEEPNGPASWLVNHYDNRTGDVTGGPAFDDSAEVKFVGTIAGIGKVTVEQSAAWTWTTFGAAGAGPCALVYDSTNPRTLVRIHKHQNVSTENVSGPLTLIPGSVVNDPGGTTEFPFAADGKGANFGVTGLDVGTQVFDGTFKVTTANGDEITGIVEGGTNCEVAAFSTVGGHPPAGVFDFTHFDTNNTVQTALEITGGTGKFTGATGTGVLVFSYDTFEPHGLLHASITLY